MLKRAAALFSLLFLVACGQTPAPAPPSPEPAPAPAAEIPAEQAPAEQAPAEQAAKAQPAPKAAPSLHNLTVTTIDEEPRPLSAYKGKALLIVNTASECGFTPQYAGLEKLYRTYRERGLEVLAFPSNDFGGQEPGDAEAIKHFTAENFEITFQLFDKVHAKGEEIAPLFERLTSEGPEATRGEVKWNFTKWLVNGEGQVIARFESKVKPMDEAVTRAVEAALPSAAP